MQRLKLEHCGKFFGAPQLVPNHIRSDFRCERKRKSHKKRGFYRETLGVSMSRPVLYCESASSDYLDLHEDSSVSVPNIKINLRLRWICMVKLNNWES